MASIFNNESRMSSDMTDQTERTLQNTRFSNYRLASYANDTASNGHIDFALTQPTMMTSGTALGRGVNSAAVDEESALTLKRVQERHYEKLQLFQRPFLTVPYLGRGSCDPTLESQLLIGESVTEKKSVSTVMEKSFGQYALYPVESEKGIDEAKVIEEAALNGWVRGGVTTRDSTMSGNSRPASSF